MREVTRDPVILNGAVTAGQTTTIFCRIVCNGIILNHSVALVQAAAIAIYGCIAHNRVSLTSTLAPIKPPSAITSGIVCDSIILNGGVGITYPPTIMSSQITCDCVALDHAVAIMQTTAIAVYGCIVHNRAETT